MKASETASREEVVIVGTGRAQGEKAGRKKTKHAHSHVRLATPASREENPAAQVVVAYRTNSMVQRAAGTASTAGEGITHSKHA